TRLRRRGGGGPRRYGRKLRGALAPWRFYWVSGGCGGRLWREKAQGAPKAPSPQGRLPPGAPSQKTHQNDDAARGPFNDFKRRAPWGVGGPRVFGPRADRNRRHGASGSGGGSAGRGGLDDAPRQSHGGAGGRPDSSGSRAG